MDAEKTKKVAAFRDSMSFPLNAGMFAAGEKLANSQKLAIRLWIEVLDTELSSLQPVLLAEFNPSPAPAGGEYSDAQKWAVSHNRRTYLEVYEFVSE